MKINQIREISSTFVPGEVLKRYVKEIVQELLKVHCNSIYSTKHLLHADVTKFSGLLNFSALYI